MLWLIFLLLLLLLTVVVVLAPAVGLAVGPDEPVVKVALAGVVATVVDGCIVSSVLMKVIGGEGGSGVLGLMVQMEY
jgi:hypothetical protein